MKKSIIAIMLLIAVVAGCFALVGCNKEDPSTVKDGAYTIGVQSGTTGEYYVKGDADWGFDGYANNECKGYANGGLAVQDMLNGKVDFVVIDEAPAKAIAASAAFNGKVKVINVPLTVEEYAFGVNKNDAELLTKVNDFLTKIKGNGQFDAIMNKYFNGEEVTGIESATYDANKAQLVVATNAAFAPFEYKIGNKFAGIDMEIAALLAQELNMELVIKDMDFDSVVISVGTEGIDIAMAGLTVNETRKQSVNFSNSYYNAAQVIIVKADDAIFDGCTTAEQVEAILNGTDKVAE